LVIKAKSFLELTGLLSTRCLLLFKTKTELSGLLLSTKSLLPELLGSQGFSIAQQSKHLTTLQLLLRLSCGLLLFKATFPEAQLACPKCGNAANFTEHFTSLQCLLFLSGSNLLFKPPSAKIATQLQLTSTEFTAQAELLFSHTELRCPGSSLFAKTATKLTLLLLAGQTLLF